MISLLRIRLAALELLDHLAAHYPGLDGLDLSCRLADAIDETRAAIRRRRRTRGARR